MVLSVPPVRGKFEQSWATLKLEPAVELAPADLGASHWQSCQALGVSLPNELSPAERGHGCGQGRQNGSLETDVEGVRTDFYSCHRLIDLDGLCQVLQPIYILFLFSPAEGKHLR